MYYWKAICESRHSNKQLENVTSVDAKTARARNCVNLQLFTGSTTYCLPLINLGTNEKEDRS